MGFEDDVNNIFDSVLNDCNGNKLEAAERLGVSQGTYWNWVTRRRGPFNKAFASAMDTAGAYLLVEKNNIKIRHLGESEKVMYLLDKIESISKELEIEKAISERLQNTIQKTAEKKGRNFKIKM